MKTAIVYARVSTQRQADEGVSMDAQIEQCTARAAKLGADVVRVFRDDGISGKSVRGRAGFQAAIEYCVAAGVDYFVTWSTSRFARNAVDLFMFQDALKEGGTKLECLNADVDDDTDAGFVNRMFFGTMDQLMSRAIARDTLRSQKRAASEGFFTGGRVPFGYLAVPEGKRTRLVVHPEQAPVIRRIFDLCIRDGQGAQAIALAMNGAGLLRGNGQRWGKNSIHYILKNEIYTGLKTFNKTSGKTGKLKPREQWIQVQAHEALVAKDDFERAQAMIENRTPHEQGGTPRSQFVFSGRLKCAICGEQLQITNGKGRNGTLYSYYACVGHRKGADRCTFKPMRADQFDYWLTNEILEKILTPVVVKKALTDVGEMMTTWLDDRKLSRSGLVKELRGLEAQREKLLDVVAAHGSDPADVKPVLKRLREVSEGAERLERELDALEKARMPRRLPEIDPAVAIEVMHEVIAAGDAQKKRAFMGAFLGSITVSTRVVEIEYKADALLQTAPVTSVHSGFGWLLDLGSNQGPTD